MAEVCRMNLGSVLHTTGTSKSYKSFQACDSGGTISTSLNSKGLESQTSERTDLAAIHSPQCFLVKNVILQDWKSLLVMCISSDQKIWSPVSSCP